MGNKFHKINLHESEKAEETWVNLEHIVAITPDPKNRFMVVVLDVVDFNAFSWGPKLYKITFECGKKLLEI